MDGEPELLELVIPHLEDMQAREVFGQAKKAAQNMKVDSRFVYRHNRREAIHNVWQHIEPYDTIVAAEQAKSIWGVTPDSLEYEHVPEGEVAHLHKAWSRQASHSPIP